MEESTNELLAKKSNEAKISKIYFMGDKKFRDKKLRDIRIELRKKNRTIAGLKLTETLDNYAETG